ncbi:MAG: hypothetical protein LBU47_05515, partial [Christensenellaceae bacterium]|nr:hypothetical protein [Christensenellaceae bacterium]
NAEGRQQLSCDGQPISERAYREWSSGRLLLRGPALPTGGQNSRPVGKEQGGAAIRSSPSKKGTAELPRRFAPWP